MSQVGFSNGNGDIKLGQTGLVTLKNDGLGWGNSPLQNAQNSGFEIGSDSWFENNPLEGNIWKKFTDLIIPTVVSFVNFKILRPLHLLPLNNKSRNFGLSAEISATDCHEVMKSSEFFQNTFPTPPPSPKK